MSGNTSQLYRFKSHRFECLGGIDSLNRLSRFEMNYESLNDIDSSYLKVGFSFSFFEKSLIFRSHGCKIVNFTISKMEFIQ